MSELLHVKGLPQLEKTLGQVPAKLEAKILRGALRAGANVVLNEVRSRVPVKSGRLAKTLRISTGVRRGVVTARVVAGDRKRGVFYAHMVEGGTKRHTIRGRRGKGLRIGGIEGRVIVTNRVEHPGARARPFMRPALESSATAALEAVAAYIRKRLDQVVK